MHSLSILIISFLLIIGKLATGQSMQLTIKQIKCFNENSGSIIVNIDSSFNEAFTVVIADSAHKILTQFYDRKQQPWELKDLKAGKYIITLQTKDNSSKEKQIAEIINPDGLKTNIITIESVSKDDPPTYSLKANPSGGKPPYDYKWSKNSGNQTFQIASGLKEGTYTCSINDLNGCGPKVATFFLYDPEIQKYKQQKRKK
jgi:hypothetical protein